MNRLSFLLLFVPTLYAPYSRGPGVLSRPDTSGGDTTGIPIRPMGTHPWLPTEPGGPSGPTIPTPFDPGDIPGKGDITFPPDSNRLAWANYYPDTLGYLIANFGNLNKRKYIGQPFENVINDYQLPIKHCETLPQGKSDITSAVLQYLSFDGAVLQLLANKPVHYVYVTFKDTMHFDPPPIFDATYPVYNRVETDARKVAMKMKDATFLELEVLTSVH